MANILPIDKQIAAIGALAEGNSIRSIERMTGVHRDTIMRLGIRVGQSILQEGDIIHVTALVRSSRQPTKTTAQFQQP